MSPCAPQPSRLRATVRASALIVALLPVASVGLAQSAPAPATVESSTTLSPFVVSTSKDVGFVAANSLSGGRTAADLADTPVAYSVQTKEFLDALNLTSLDDAMEWSVNTQKYVADQGAGVALGVDANSVATTRGIAVNPPMRNFFNVSYTLDSYNTERFDYTRGPNSVLFGAGTIGGAANNATKFAILNHPIHDLRVQVDSHGSVRFTADLNQPIGEKNALRVNLVQDNGKTWRDGEVKDIKGAAASTTITLLPKTQLRVSGEYVTDFIRQMISPLRDNLSGWDGTTFGLQPFTVSATDQATYNIHGVSRIGASAAAQNYVMSPDRSEIINYAGTVQTLGYNINMRPLNGQVPLLGSLNLANAPILGLPENLPASLQDLYGVAAQNSDFRIPSRKFTNLGTAPVGTDRDKDVELALNQTVGDSLFFELAGDANTRNNYGNGSYWYSDSVTGFGATFVDANKFLPTGATNPEFQQVYQQAGLDRRFQNSVYFGAHLAAAFAKEWSWIGVNLNSIAGVDRDSVFTVREIGVLPINADPREWGLNNAASFPILYRQYFNQVPQSPPQLEVPTTVVNPLTGSTTTMTPVWTLSTSRTEGGVTESWKNTNYVQTSAQLSFWQKRLIFLGAFRLDDLYEYQKLGLRAESYPTGFVATNDHYMWRPDAPANWAALPSARPVDSLGVPLAANLAQQYQNDYNPPSISYISHTKSLGGILKLAYGFSAFGNYGTTFNPGGIGNETIYFQTPAASTSDSTELGLRYALPGGKIFASLTHFTSQTQANTSGQPPGYTNFNTIINTASIGNPSSGTNSRGLGALPFTWYDSNNLAAKGWEVEITANLTPHWRLLYNLGTTNATQGNNYPQTRQWLAEHTPILTQILNDAGVVIVNNVASVPIGAVSSTTAAAGATAWNSLQANAANWVAGNQLLSHMVKFTTNIYTDYTFEGRGIKGLRLGAGLRYRGPEVIGYRGADTIPNSTTTAVDDPAVSAYTAVWDHSYGIVTLTAAYPVKFGRHEVDFNLTINNAGDLSSPIYNNTGLRPYQGILSSPARVTVPADYSYIEPRTYRLSADYRF